MNEKLKKLYDERLKIDTDQRKLLETADAEKRGLTPDEETNYQNMDKRFNDLTKESADEETKEVRMKEHIARSEMFNRTQNEPIKPEPMNQHRDTEKEKRIIERRKDPVRNGIEEWRSTPEYVEAFRNVLSGNISAKEARSNLPVEIGRTLQADKDIVGGFLVVPEQFMTDLIQDLKNAVFIRALARNIAMPKADRIAWPVLDDTIDDSNWTSELKTGSEDATMDFEKMSLTPHPSAKRVFEIEVVVVPANKGLPAKFAITVDGEGENDAQSGHTLVVEPEEKNLLCNCYRYDRLLYLQPGVEVPLAESYSFLLRREGSRWWLSVNGVPLFEGVDAPRLPACRIGLQSWGREPLFESFRLARLEPRPR